MQRFNELLSIPNRLRYLAWLAAPVAPRLSVNLRSGEKLSIRKGILSDLWVAREVFSLEVYKPPRPIDCDSVKRIVDVGANIGFSILYLGRAFPMARIEAFEPHPVHTAILRRHVAVNRMDDRVIIHEAAAGIEDGAVHLIDDGGSSSIVRAAEANTIPVPIVDFFKTIEPGRIDLLKMDCEGGEWDIVMDPRFETLDVGAIVMEWHAFGDHPEADREICERLERLGWSVMRSSEGLYGGCRLGMFWAYR